MLSNNMDEFHYKNMEKNLKTHALCEFCTNNICIMAKDAFIREKNNSMLGEHTDKRNSYKCHVLSVIDSPECESLGITYNFTVKGYNSLRHAPYLARNTSLRNVPGSGGSINSETISNSGANNEYMLLECPTTFKADPQGVFPTRQASSKVDSLGNSFIREYRDASLKSSLSSFHTIPEELELVHVSSLSHTPPQLLASRAASSRNSSPCLTRFASIKKSGSSVLLNPKPKVHFSRRRLSGDLVNPSLVATARKVDRKIVDIILRCLKRTYGKVKRATEAYPIYTKEHLEGNHNTGEFFTKQYSKDAQKVKQLFRDMVFKINNKTRGYKEKFTSKVRYGTHEATKTNLISLRFRKGWSRIKYALSFKSSTTKLGKKKKSIETLSPETEPLISLVQSSKNNRNPGQNKEIPILAIKYGYI